MSRMLKNDADKKMPQRKLGAQSLFIQNALFTNTAAKFWSALIDEVDFDYTDCDVIVLDTLTDIQLGKELLFPEASLQKELERHIHEQWQIQDALRKAIEEFELLGPPDTVHITLFSGDIQKKKCDLPVECLDADIFPYLLVWLLEWSEIPEFLWNGSTVQGDFHAIDRARSVYYYLNTGLDNVHVSEGLFRRTLTIRCLRKKK